MGRKLTVFALFYFVLEGKFQVQASQGAYIRRGDLTEDFLRYDFMGLINGMAYFRNFTLFGLSITRQTSDANDLVYAKNHATEKPLLTGDIYRTILRIQVTSLLPWVPEVFFLVCDGELRFVGRRPTRVRPKAELTRETAQPGTQGTSLPITDGA